MPISVKQISALEKVRAGEACNCPEISQTDVLAGERFSYQLRLEGVAPVFVRAHIESPLSDSVTLYRVRDAVMDAPVIGSRPIEDYITHTPGLMPDILVPLEETAHRVTLDNCGCTLWVRVDIPADIQPGSYPIRIRLQLTEPGGDSAGEQIKEMQLQVLPVVKPAQKLIYTRWMYLDCIATAHHVQIFSEAHWQLIDRYIAAAADVGVNMMLLSVHTPPLDTEVGTARPCVQLVDIEKTENGYAFGFEKLHRFIVLCKKHCIRYYEVAHMFSQWGAKCTPNIMVTENGKTDYRFGWHVSADDPEYIAFLQQYIPAIIRELDLEGITENTYFHISDEPNAQAEEKYRRVAGLLHPLIGKCKSFDAISDYLFYEKGLVECPVTCIEHIHKFLEHDISNQWIYYCCIPQNVFPNAFLAMPSYRIRILGFLLYRYDIKGFLHWGFNFYHACRSLYPIDPYLTTSGDHAYPSGDPFIVYPAKNGVYNSIRGEVTYQAVQDMDLCFALEEKLGRAAVVAMIDHATGRLLRFDDYPRSNTFIESLRAAMLNALSQE